MADDPHARRGHPQRLCRGSKTDQAYPTLHAFLPAALAAHQRGSRTHSIGRGRRPERVPHRGYWPHGLRRRPPPHDPLLRGVRSDRRPELRRHRRAAGKGSPGHRRRRQARLGSICPTGVGGCSHGPWRSALAGAHRPLRGSLQRRFLGRGARPDRRVALARRRTSAFVRSRRVGSARSAWHPDGATRRRWRYRGFCRARLGDVPRPARRPVRWRVCGLLFGSRSDGEADRCRAQGLGRARHRFGNHRHCPRRPPARPAGDLAELPLAAHGQGGSVPQRFRGVLARGNPAVRSTCERAGQRERAEPHSAAGHRDSRQGPIRVQPGRRGCTRRPWRIERRGRVGAERDVGGERRSAEHQSAAPPQRFARSGQLCPGGAGARLLRCRRLQRGGAESERQAARRRGKRRWKAQSRRQGLAIRRCAGGTGPHDCGAGWPRRRGDRAPVRDQSRGSEPAGAREPWPVPGERDDSRDAEGSYGHRNRACRRNSSRWSDARGSRRHDRLRPWRRTRVEGRRAPAQARVPQPHARQPVVRACGTAVELCRQAGGPSLGTGRDCTGNRTVFARRVGRSAGETHHQWERGAASGAGAAGWNAGFGGPRARRLDVPRRDTCKCLRRRGMDAGAVVDDVHGQRSAHEHAHLGTHPVGGILRPYQCPRKNVRRGSGAAAGHGAPGPDRCAPHSQVTDRQGRGHDSGLRARRCERHAFDGRRGGRTRRRHDRHDQGLAHGAAHFGAVDEHAGAR